MNIANIGIEKYYESEDMTPQQKLWLATHRDPNYILCKVRGLKGKILIVFAPCENLPCPPLKDLISSSPVYDWDTDPFYDITHNFSINN